MAHQLTLNSTALDELKALAQALPEAKTLQESKSVTPSTSAQTVTPDSGYDGLEQIVVNAMPTATLATPTIEVSSSGVITAKVNQSSGGYIASGKNTSATKSLTTQAAQTITPGTSNKTIASGRYLTGTQTIKGDANLVAENIAEGVSIFGVTGTHAGGSGGGSAVETCTVRLQGDQYSDFYHCVYGCVENGETTYKSIQGEYGTYEAFDYTLENVVVGSMIALYVQGKYDLSYETENLIGISTPMTASDIYFQVDAPSGGLATFFMTGDD